MRSEPSRRFDKEAKIFETLLVFIAHLIRFDTANVKDVVFAVKRSVLIIVVLAKDLASFDHVTESVSLFIVNHVESEGEKEHQ